ncbi:MAG: AMP-binding protein [Cytophagales bacterium]|nr:AMP-binding protein [Cytophagales bacterium]
MESNQIVKDTKITIKQLVDLGLDEIDASKINDEINNLLNNYSAPVCWQKICKEILSPDIPFPIHQLIFDAVYADWDDSKGPKPVWLPSGETIKTSNISKIQTQLGIADYKDFHTWSVCNRAAFWELMVNELGIRFKDRYKKIVVVNGHARSLQNGLENPDWLVGAKMNIADSCFQDNPQEPAIIYQAEGGKINKMSHQQLEKFSNRVANGLTALGLKRGDAAAIDMIMTAEAVAIYLGIIKAGCVVVSIADSLAPGEVAKRLQISNAKLIFTQDFIIRGEKKLPLYDKILKADPPVVVVLPVGNGHVEHQRNPDSVGAHSLQIRKQDMIWDNFLSKDDKFDSVSSEPAGHVNILFSSGTTGDPKAIPWTHTTPIKCAADGYLHQNIQPGDVVAWPTNIGWMMGPWLIFASLINKATIALYYGAPVGREFGQFVQDAKVNMLGVVPSMVKRWIETDCMNGLDWSNIKVFSSTGEASNSQDYGWLMSKAGYKPVIEYCGGTEIGGGYITGTVVQPAVPAAFSTPALGLDFILLDENGKQTQNGEIFLVPPSIGLSTELLNKEHHKEYYAGNPDCTDNMEGAFGKLLKNELNSPPLTPPKGGRTGQHFTLPRGKSDGKVLPSTREGFRGAVDLRGANPILRSHGDQIERLPGNYFRALGRADDTMNLGGIKVSSAEIERTLNNIDGIRETAAIAVNPPGGGPSQLVIYAIVTQPRYASRSLSRHSREGRHLSCEKQELISIFQKSIKENLNPLFKVMNVVVLDELPRTASNKVMRRVLRNLELKNNG